MPQPGHLSPVTAKNGQGGIQLASCGLTMWRTVKLTTPAAKTARSTGLGQGSTSGKAYCATALAAPSMTATSHNIHPARAESTFTQIHVFAVFDAALAPATSP